MNILDQFFGWLTVALGVTHCVTSFRIQPLSHLTVLLSGTGAAIVAGGFLNVVRVRHRDGLTRAFSLVTNLMVLVLAVGLAWPLRQSLLHDWQRLGLLIVILVELLFAFLG